MSDIKFSSSSLERFILSYLIKDKSFFLKVAQYLKTSDFVKKSYFIDSKLQWILNTCLIYYSKYDRIPSLDTIKILSEGKFKNDALLSSSMLKAVDEIYTKDLSTFEADYLKDETVKFIKTARAVEATLQNELDISNGNFEGLTERMQKAVNINLDKDLGISLADTKATLDLIQEQDEGSGITFGSSALDRILGSPRAGELTVFCGTPGIGKTIWLGNVATENMKLGKKGIFFSLEVDKKRLAKRLYSSLLYKSGVDVLNTTVEEANAVFAQYDGGDIRIKNYQAHAASCNDFANCLMNLYTVEGFVPDYIVIDYILITATNNRQMDSTNSYGYYKAVSEEMRNLGIQFNCPVFSAAQLNRDSQGEKTGTKALVTSKNLSESRGILDTCDYLMIINQTDSEKKIGEKDGVAEQRLLVEKNRNGQSNQILNFTLDYNTMTIREGKKERRI